MVGFQAHTQQEHQQALAQYLPNDRLFLAKTIKETNLYKLLTGLSGEFQRVDAIFQSVWDGTNILNTQDPNYMALWEGMVGIPNSYFTQTTQLTLEERRQQVLIQLRSLGVLTAQDFINLAALLGQTITIQQGINLLYPPYAVPFFPWGSARQARFIMVVGGLNIDSNSYPPYTPPFLPQAPFSQLQDLFNILKPANTIIIYLNS